MKRQISGGSCIELSVRCLLFDLCPYYPADREHVSQALLALVSDRIASKI